MNTITAAEVLVSIHQQQQQPTHHNYTRAATRHLREWWQRQSLHGQTEKIAPHDTELQALAIATGLTPEGVRYWIECVNAQTHCGVSAPPKKRLYI